MLADACFDIGYNLGAFLGAENKPQLVEIFLKKTVGVLVDVENLAVDICCEGAFHWLVMGGGVGV